LNETHSLVMTSVAAKWHLNPSSGFYGVQPSVCISVKNRPTDGQTDHAFVKSVQ